MIAASLMTIRPLMVKLFPRLFLTTNDSQPTNSNSAAWRPKEFNVIRGRIWSKRSGTDTASEVQLTTHDVGNEESGELKVRVRTEFEMNEAKRSSVSNSVP